MKRIITLVLAGSAVAVLAQIAGAQTRPRRVGQTQTSQQQNQPSQPQPTSEDASQASRSGRPPVLSGGNRNPSEQQPASTATQNAGPEEVSEGDIVRVNTTLVSLPVSVTDRDGKYIPNLRKEDFRVWEDGVEQQVAYFASTEKPFTVALVIDTSGSVRERLREIQDAAMSFINDLRPDDRVMVVSFDDKIRFILSDPTNDRNAIRGAIQQVQAGSGTRLYDAVDQVINRLNRIEGRKAIVLFTDGVDTTSKHQTYESSVSEAEELDALIYPIEFDTYQDTAGWPGSGSRRGGGNPGGSGNPNGRSSGSVLGDILGGIFGGGGNYPNGGGGGRGGGGRGGRGWPGGGGRGDSREEYERGDRYLNDLARVTGARLYKPENDNLNVAFRQVAEELRRQYSLGYYPKKAPQPGERRAIKVRVDRPELAVRTRDNYVFQPGANTAQGQTNPQSRPPVLKKELSGSF
jgi:Ca-activated chloride channel family protein